MIMKRGPKRRRCRPCNRERNYREWLKSPNFPVDFPCRHPAMQDDRKEMAVSLETTPARRYAEEADATLKAHKQHCSLPRCGDCSTLLAAKRAAWAAWQRSRQADREPTPGQEPLF